MEEPIECRGESAPLFSRTKNSKWGRVIILVPLVPSKNYILSVSSFGFVSNVTCGARVVMI